MVAPRHVLRQVLDRARQMGYRVCFGTEMEFYVFDGTDGAGNWQPSTPDTQCFAEYRQAEAKPVLGPLIDHLARQGMAIHDVENEHGPGQFELNCRPKEGLAGIDDQFHNAVAQASRSPRLKQAIPAARGELFIPTDRLIYEELVDVSYLGHRAVYDAIRRRDAAAAASAMERHIEETRRDLRRILFKEGS